jgi:hypothetical protein
MSLLKSLKENFFLIVIPGIILFYLYLLTLPSYWSYLQAREEARLKFINGLLHKKEQFRGGEAIGGRTAGPSNLGDLEGFRLNEADLIYTSKRESFRGGGGEAIGGRTAGPSNLGDLGNSEELFTTEQDQKKKEMIQEAFQNIGPASEVVGKSEVDSTDGPAPSALDTPRKPYNLLEQLPAAPRGSISCLKASCCAETDFEWRTNLTGNYLQRTNNYKREFPDNCSGPLHELTLAFYKPDVLQKV